MKKTLIIYNSQTGNTQKFGDEIGSFCSQNGLETKSVSITEFTSNLNIQY